MNIEKKDLDQLNFLIREERFQDALNLFAKVKTLQSYQAQYLKAVALEGVKKLPEALTILEHLYKQNPENLNVINKAARIAEELDRVEESREFYERVLFLDPFNKEAKERIRQLQDRPAKSESLPVETSKASDDTTPAPPSDDKPKIEFEKINIGEEFDQKIQVDQDRLTAGESKDEPAKDSGDSEDELPDITLPEEPAAPLPDPEEKQSISKEGPEKLHLREMMDEDINHYFNIDPSAKKSTPNIPEPPPTEEPVTEKDEEFGFVTVSAARLYEKQKLFDEAVAIYEKLEQKNNKPGSFHRDIQRVAQLKKYHLMIEKLTGLKEQLKRGAQGV